MVNEERGTSMYVCWSDAVARIWLGSEHGVIDS
jgi:hypothetical protein